MFSGGWDKGGERNGGEGGCGLVAQRERKMEGEREHKRGNKRIGKRMHDKNGTPDVENKLRTEKKMIKQVKDTEKDVKH